MKNLLSAPLEAIKSDLATEINSPKRYQLLRRKIVSLMALVTLLPLKYLAYFPATVFLGKVHGAELVRELCIAAGWVIVFMIVSRVMLRLGVKRYSGYGG